MTSLTVDTTLGFQHILAVLRRWWLLLAIGTLLAVGFGVAAGLSSPTHFVADSQLFVNQPGQTLEPGGAEAVRRLSELMKTLGQIATSDASLDGVRQQTESARSVADLRDHVTATPIANTLILSIRTDFPTSAEAAEVNAALITQAQARIGALSDASGSPLAHLTVETVQAPTAKQVTSGLARTVVVAFILGLGFSVVAAFALDRG